jgi:thioredoxin reductase (NADPH)
MPDNPYDVMILGTGPAGLTAAIFAQRLGLRSVALGDIPGGNLYMIESLMNFPGFPGGVPGTQFGAVCFQQAAQEGAEFPMARLEKLTHAGGLFHGVDANGQVYRASTAIAATGRVPKRLPVPRASMKGIHFCSICDGPLYRGQRAVLAVVGSDNAAGQHALTLCRVAEHVLLVCRSSRLKMDAAHQRQIASQPNIRALVGHDVIGFRGLDLVEALIVNASGGEPSDLRVDGVFLAIGWTPNTGVLDLEVEKTADGYLKTDARLMTSFPGLFAAGDVRDTDMWQVVTACADGARAAKFAAEFLETR